MTDYIVDNKNPVIGQKQANGKQEISIHDYDTGNRRYITTDSTKIDEFVSKRKDTLKKASIIGAAITIGATAIGALIGRKIAVNSILNSAKKGLSSFGEEEKWISAATGGMLGFLPGYITSLGVLEHSDKKVTQEFINENK